ncbi:cell division protein FtsK [Secundilactobacillus paracollinoides]|uniref:DNA translocase FtsK n=1 Tax=Secundilactobacillus paracollinoides TaxID=240427 RepID=A0A1B2J0A5_9LACO|nr:DNA translocase FtsK [Secundilactobacillus paracollinoides]ANZ61751.1 cell division protein FtsK [Secundilactobacillus paracollinoides]ANZ63386.1 cell division protein FtsK [Secundilactobacillus paracollinoides]ANZ67670.1 cell division protein FtsK [Secundilactobacillus paracollinoides]
MAQKRRQTRRKTTSRGGTKRPTKRKTAAQQHQYTGNVIGLILLLVCLLALLQAGIIGTLAANLIRFVVGDTYQFVGLVGGAVGLALLITGKLPTLKRHFIVGVGIAYVGLLLWLHTALFLAADQHTGFVSYTLQLLNSDIANGSVSQHIGGGMVGAVFLTITNFLVSLIGTQIIAVILMIVGVMVFFNIPMAVLFQGLSKGCHVVWQGITRLGNSLVTGVQSIIARQRQRAAQKPAKPKQSKPKPRQQSETVATSQAPLTAPEEKTLPTPVSERQPASDKIPISVASQPKPAAQTKPEEDDDTDLSMLQTQDDDPNYQLPDTSLLTPIPKKDQTDDYQTIEKNTKILQQTLASFGVDAEVKHVNLGPSVTEYELHPAIGVKVSRIVNLSNDLALALAAKDIRIEAPIPGKSLIGIEVPNREISTVAFRDVSEAVPHGPAHMLEVPLGRDVTGKVITCDLTKMPHLLIAGSTGSGKSVAINGIITSILMNAKPSQAKLMLIDPKKVELSVYNGIPHLLTPVVSEPKKAARALHKVVHEMEQRYDLFAKVGQRKISGYNKFVQEQNQETDKPLPVLPYIVVIVDELADLMMTVSNEVEDAIIRLAQMGRAAGIHMILATQRPSVDVITGLIKANVPSRIAFAVSSGVDSRTILDSNGAEKLLGRGDMLYMPIDQNSPVRVQGAFISDQDVERVADFIREEQPAEYDEQMMVSDEEVAEGDTESSEDDLFNDALDFVVDQQKASTSLLQRHFRIGYNRAARLIDDLEQGGFIGPQDGSKPRQVYKQKPADPGD